MLSHDLARELLRRRDNDVAVTVIVDNGVEYEATANLRDHDDAFDWKIASSEVVGYNPSADRTVIAASAVAVGPRRGDLVEAWIKRRRDGNDKGTDAYDVLDNLLDDYRLHADTGTDLSESVERVES